MLLSFFDIMFPSMNMISEESGFTMTSQACPRSISPVMCSTTRPPSTTRAPLPETAMSEYCPLWAGPIVTVFPDADRPVPLLGSEGTVTGGNSGWVVKAYLLPVMVPPAPITSFGSEPTPEKVSSFTTVPGPNGIRSLVALIVPIATSTSGGSWVSAKLQGCRVKSSSR